MEPKETFFRVMISKDSFILFQYWWFQSWIHRTFPTWNSPKSHRLSIWPYLSFQSMEMWDSWHFVVKVSSHIKRWRAVNRQDMCSIDVVAPNDIGWCIFKGKDNGAWVWILKFPINFSTICENFCCWIISRQKLVKGSFHVDFIAFDWQRI